MKIALLTDTHYGARGDNGAFDKHFKKFYEETFFPTLERESIHRVVHLGDMFDRRKYINYLTLNNCREYFFDNLVRVGATLDVIVGNHDVFYKNTNKINSPELLLKEYENITVWKDPTEVVIDDLLMLFLPWITSDNYEQSMKMIKKTKAQVCFGHLEIAGFQMYKGHKNDHGFDSNIFTRFDLVCSGHFHHRSRSGNIQYLGNPYELTWADYQDPRGFHIFDTETRELEFIRNPLNVFHKIFFNDSYTLQNYDHLKDCFVKIINQSKESVLLDMLVDKLEKADVADLQVVEDHHHLDLQNEQEIIEDAEDTLSILTKFCEQIDTDVDKSKLNNLMKNLYNEAQDLETS
jgi:predicted phosphodiesterase